MQTERENPKIYQSIFRELRELVGTFLSPNLNFFPVLVALIGAFCMYLGYELFMSGITQGGASIKLWSRADDGLEMGKGGPGLIFSLFGMIIVVVAIFFYNRIRAQGLKKHVHSSP